MTRFYPCENCGVPTLPQDIKGSRCVRRSCARMPLRRFLIPVSHPDILPPAEDALDEILRKLGKR